jgi:RecB family exonuclease
MPDVSDRDVFETGIANSNALLPGAPRYWSYSSLKQVEQCPRSYALSRASYPDLWESDGYPQAPVSAALFGDVVHGAIERILTALAAADCASLKSAGAVNVLRELGGYTAVAEQVLQARLAKLDGNPRLSGDRRRRLDRMLGDQIADARGDIQEYLSRMSWLPSAPRPSSSGKHTPDGQKVPGRREVTNGTYPELDLIAEELRLIGRIDLLTLGADGARITDFKTGVEDPAHREQLQTYALLWARDRVVNPHSWACTEVRAAYLDHDLVFPVPDHETLGQIEANFAMRVQAADESLEPALPDARLSDRCSRCSVRPLCHDYWVDRAAAVVPETEGTWFDLEGLVASQHGPKSWIVQPEGKRRQVLIRTPSPTDTLPLGKSLRFVGVRRVIDPDDPDAVIAAIGVGTETYLLV